MEKEIVIAIISGVVSVTTSFGTIFITHRLNRRKPDEASQRIYIAPEDLAALAARSEAARIPRERSRRKRRSPAEEKYYFPQPSPSREDFNLKSRHLPALWRACVPIYHKIKLLGLSKTIFLLILLELFGVVSGYVLRQHWILGIFAVVLFLGLYALRFRGRPWFALLIALIGALANVVLGYVALPVLFDGS